MLYKVTGIVRMNINLRQPEQIGKPRLTRRCLAVKSLVVEVDDCTVLRCGQHSIEGIDEDFLKRRLPSRRGVLNIRSLTSKLPSRSAKAEG